MKRPCFGRCCILNPLWWYPAAIGEKMPVPADDHHQITIETSLSSPGSADVMVDRSFADISNADYLESCNEQGLSDEFYPTDLF